MPLSDLSECPSTRAMPPILPSLYAILCFFLFSTFFHFFSYLLKKLFFASLVHRGFIAVKRCYYLFYTFTSFLKLHRCSIFKHTAQIYLHHFTTSGLNSSQLRELHCRASLSWLLFYFTDFAIFDLREPMMLRHVRLTELWKVWKWSIKVTAPTYNNKENSCLFLIGSYFDCKLKITEYCILSLLKSRLQTDNSMTDMSIKVFPLITVEIII